MLIKTAPSEASKVCVMSSNNTKRSLFCEKQESKQPIQLTGLSPSKSGITFFNGNSGGRLVGNAEVTFQYVDEKHINIKNILDNGINGLFDVTAKLKWTDSETTVCRREKDSKTNQRWYFR